MVKYNIISTGSDGNATILEDFAQKLSDIAVIDKPAKLEGKSMVMFLVEKRN